jgi:ArsR family transcriptional regulator, cadmium/lead-responsive transcriptional repressor
LSARFFGVVVAQGPPEHCEMGPDVVSGGSLSKDMCSFEVREIPLWVGVDHGRGEVELLVDGGTNVSRESGHALTIVHVVVNYQGVESDSPLTRVGTALADPVRQRVLVSLVERPATPTELVALLGVSKTVLSNHLACLRGCGLVVGEPAGRTITYRLVSAHLAHALTDLMQLEAGLTCATHVGEQMAPSRRRRGR